MFEIYGTLCYYEEITMYWSRNIEENKKVLLGGSGRMFH